MQNQRQACSNKLATSAVFPFHVSSLELALLENGTDEARASIYVQYETIILL